MRKALRYTRPDRKKSENERRSADWPNCGGERVPNVKRAYNFAKAKTKAVAEVEKSGYHESLPSKYKPNSVIKKIVADCVVTERYYDERGQACLDIDYSNHGSHKAHPVVPHLHSLRVNKDGKLLRTKPEDE